MINMCLSCHSGPSKLFGCSTPLLGLKNSFKCIGSWSRVFFLFREVSTFDHQNFTPSLVDNKIENFFDVAALDCE